MIAELKFQTSNQNLKSAQLSSQRLPLKKFPNRRSTNISQQWNRIIIQSKRDMSWQSIEISDSTIIELNRWIKHVK